MDKARQWGGELRLYSDERIELSAREDGLFIQCRKPMELKEVNEILSSMPRLQVGNFTALRDALIKANGQEVYIGAYKPEIELELMKDGLSAYIKLNMTQAEYAAKKEQIVSDIIGVLNTEQITVGILSEVLTQPLEIQKRILIAQGILPVPGIDAKLSYYQLSEKKPELKTDGGVDHFDIHLIDPINSGDWLGEKIPATAGEAGLTVKGEIIPTKPGKDLQLRYDSETVQKFELVSGNSVLRARITGAVSVRNQSIAVEQHLIIMGNVDYSTGNIDFDGFVTVNGTIEDCFSVKGTKDVSIMGPMGVGAVTLIESREGSVFIRGGMNGKGTGRVKAAKNIYLKYVSEAFIEANGIVQIGVYAYDATITASKIEMMKRSGKVVGGSMVAKHQIVSGVIGNQFERETNVQVIGFDRPQLKMEYDNLQSYYATIIERANKIKRQLEMFQLNMSRLDQKAVNTFHIMQQEFDKAVIEITNVKETLAHMEEVLRIRGDGEIKIMDQVFPKSSLEIKNHKKRINDVLTGSFYVKDNTLHHTDI